MRIQRFDVTAFGTLRRFSGEGLADRPLFVLLGDNETGKSTWFEFLTTALFGWKPANKELHPYAPWDGASPEGSVSFVFADGRRAEVHRRLRSQPEGRLLLQGSLDLAQAPGEAENLGNHPVPWVGTLGREMYRSVHALTLDEAQDLSDEAWASIEERLLGGTHLPFLRSCREATATLDEEAGRLWRPTQRGKAEDKLLQERLKALRAEREQAAERLHRLIELHDQIAGHDGRLAGTRTLLVEMRTRLLRAEKLLPVLRHLQRVEGLRGRADALVAVDDLPEDSGALLGRLRESAARERQAEHALADEVRLQQELSRLTPPEEALLSVEEELLALDGEVLVHQQDRANEQQAESQRAAKEHVLADRVATVFSAPLDARARSLLPGLSLPDLVHKVQAWEDSRTKPLNLSDEVSRATDAVEGAKREIDLLPSPAEEERLRERKGLLSQLQVQQELLASLEQEALSPDSLLALQDKQRRRKVGFGVGGVGALLLVLLAFGALTEWAILGPLAGGLLAFGVWMAFLKRADTRAAEARAATLRQEIQRLRDQIGLRGSDPLEPEREKVLMRLAQAADRPKLEAALVSAHHRREEAEARHQRAVDDCERARAAVAGMLASMPVSAKRLALPGHDLVHDLEGVCDLLAAIAGLVRDRDELRKRIAGRDARARALAGHLGGDGQAMERVRGWAEALRLAVAARHRSQQALARLPDLTTKLTAAGASHGEAEAGLATFSTRLADLDPAGDSPEAGLGALEEARSARSEASTVEASLHANYADWQERRDEAFALQARGVVLELTVEEQERLEVECGRAESGIDELTQERARLYAEQEQLASLPTVDDLDGRLGVLQEEQQALRRRRDRLSLLAAAVREADARYRERYQPAVLKDASAYVRRISGGRYDQLSTEEVDGRMRLFVKRSDSSYPGTVEHPLSRGTKEQVFLALRLALADHVDGEQPLPLLLDEIFVNWDPGRTGNVLELLAEIGAKRQVVLMTCQPAFAEMVASATGAQVLRLPSREPAPADPPVAPVAELAPKEGR